MSRIDRRGVLKAGALAGTLAAGPAVAAIRPVARLAVFDSRIAESRAFARTVAADHAIDLAREHETLFAGLRGEHPRDQSPCRVEGLTGWSDWVAVRSELEARGLRVVAEAPVRAPASGKAHLFRWTMQAR